MSFSQQAFTFRSALPLPWPSDRDSSADEDEHEDDGLCEECAKLDLEQNFARAFTLYEGARRGTNSRSLRVYRGDGPDAPPYLGHFFYVTSLGDRLSRLTLCKLCRFLRQTCVDPDRGTYKLLAICSSESYMFEAPKADARGRPEKRPWGQLDHNVFMAVVPEVPLIPKTGVSLRWFETDLRRIGPIYRLTRSMPDENRLALPQDLQPKADLDRVRSWLDLCRATHRCCAPKKPSGASLPGFRAINCMKMPLVVEERPWSQPYVALSYVWGSPSGDWPKTIVDAVEVTKRLGEQYLWVDRLCIDQSNVQEQQFLISKMDAIYEGAEFTIVAAAGDAGTGLPGVNMTPRKPQLRVELKERSRTSGRGLVSIPTTAAPDPYLEVIGITEKEIDETSNDRQWLDPHRRGLRSMMTLDMSELMKDTEIMSTYDISSEHLQVFRRLADDYGYSIEDCMDLWKEVARKLEIPLRKLIPLMISQIASRSGIPEGILELESFMSPAPVTSSSRREKPLPPGRIAGRSILISTLEDPRITISNSDWATRGWTYQEGVLSNRRLVFTEQQVYWECACMTLNESLELAVFDLHDQSGTRMADYLLSGIFDGDLHRVPELQYGFKTSADDQISDQVMKLDSHIRAFTSRNLSHDSDSLKAFLGIAAQYSTDNGLYLWLGMPVWAGSFADGRRGLQDTFAFSVSGWTHSAPRVAEGAEMYVASCARRAQFPSWTWVGWKGRAEFSSANDTGEEDELGGWVASVHVDFFTAMTSRDWVGGINRLWSAEMMLHATDGSHWALLRGRFSVTRVAAQDKTWLLTIFKPLVLRHMYLMHSTIEGEWRRLMGKQVQIHLSVPMTEAELMAGHKSGELVTVLLFASTVPFIFNGTARFLILRTSNDAGTHWERIGRLLMVLEEWEMDSYQSTAGMIASLPVRTFERNIVLT